MKPAIKKLDMSKVSQTPTTKSALKSPIGSTQPRSPISALKKQVSTSAMKQVKTPTKSEVMPEAPKIVAPEETYEEMLARQALEMQRIERQEAENQKLRERQERVAKMARMFGNHVYKVDSPRDVECVNQVDPGATISDDWSGLREVVLTEKQDCMVFKCEDEPIVEAKED